MKSLCCSAEMEYSQVMEVWICTNCRLPGEGLDNATEPEVEEPAEEGGESEPEVKTGSKLEKVTRKKG